VGASGARQERRRARDLHFAAPDAVYFIAVYAKSEKENLSDTEKKALAKILRSIQ
jgi:hypothetical protein